MPPPPIFITGLKVAGAPRPVRRLGARERGLLELTPDQKQLNIDFTGISFSTGDQLRYRYKLEGADSEWSLPSPQRTVTYARLAAGTYRFMVSAINGDGVESRQPASLEFSVLAPVWLRWWFVTILGAAVMAVIYSLHRYQLAHALALERVRTRIATDLHDDIGSSLSQIAILSEVARSGGRHEHLSRIASISRELVDSMSDIVWTINPQKDSLADLIWRMRQFAEEMFVSRGIALTFRAPESDQHLRLGAELRRQVFLIFKECVNNAVRHSACTDARIDLKVEHHTIVMLLSENGHGFDPKQGAGGHGLASMKTRAANLGGKLEIDTSDRGTVITLRAPIPGRGPKR
jgi:signal transduction histidine kinase